MLSSWFRKRRSIVVACFPKSGSTFLARFLSVASGLPFHKVYGPSKGVEQFLDESAIVKARAFVAQAHCPATKPTINAIERHQLRVVVNYRNLYDALLSYHEFYLSKGWQRVEYFGDMRGYREWTLDRQKWFQVEFVAPWFIKFFVSWQSQSVPHVVSTYEQLFANESGPTDVARKLGINLSEDDTARIMAQIAGRTRFNVGEVGRGRSWFSQEQRDAICAKAGFYDHDFGLIGL